MSATHAQKIRLARLNRSNARLRETYRNATGRLATTCIDEHIETVLDGLLLERSVTGYGLQSKHILYGAEHFIRNLDHKRELFGHHGCVNALTWSQDGRYLASAGDDTHIRFWDAESERKEELGIDSKAPIHTGHTANIFDIQFVPDTNSSEILSVSGDGSVRCFDIEMGQKYAQKPAHTIYESHTDRCKKIAVENANQFLTCSEDGTVRQYDLREAPEDAARRVPLVNLHDPKVALTVLTINQAMPYLFATGGSAPYAFLYDRRMLRHVKVQWGTTPGLLESNPSQLVRLLTTPRSPIVRELTGLKFSTANPHELLGSWLDDEIYLLDIRSDHTPAAQNQPGPIGPVVRFRAGHATYTRNDDDGDSSDGLESIHGWYFTAEPEYQPPSGMPILSPAPDYPTYSGRINGVTIKDVSFLGLNDEYIVSGSDDGGAYIWDKASGRLLTILEGDSEIVNVIAANPQWPQLAISGLSHSVKIFEPYLGVIDESKEHMDRMIAEHGEGIRGDLKGMLRGSAWQNSMVLTWDDITNLRKDK